MKRLDPYTNPLAFASPTGYVRLPSVPHDPVDAAATVARNLIVQLQGSRDGLLSLPVLYPSGAQALISISGEDGKFFVSDNGMGYREAEYYGAGRSFLVHAKAIAEKHRVGFDSRSFFTINVDADMLYGAVVLIANCSVSAVQTTANNLTYESFHSTVEVLGDRLSSVFGKEKVARDVEAKGVSGEVYRIDYSAVDDSRIGYFNVVLPHHFSLGSALTMFQDLALLQHPPSRVAMVDSRSQFGKKLMLISASAHVIDRRTPKPSIRHLLAA